MGLQNPIRSKYSKRGLNWNSQGKTERTSFELTDLAEGHYSWSVTAFDRLNRPGEPSSLNDFEVTYGAKLKAPKMLSPEVQ